MGTRGNYYSHQKTMQWQLKWAAVLMFYVWDTLLVKAKGTKREVASNLCSIVQLFELADK